MQNIGMLTSIWTTIANLFTGFFAIIPQTLYFLFTTAASLMDLFQSVIRKLAGLDVYYINGQQHEGDIVTNIVEGILGINSDYSVLTTVFWAMIIFSVVLLTLSTIIQIIKTHYDYNKEKSSPSYIIRKALMGLATLAIIPLTTILGMYISEGLLVGLDAITSGATEDNIMSSFEKESVANFKYVQSGGSRIYSSLDFYGKHPWTKGSSFSGVIFNVATHGCNRVRLGEFEAETGQSNSHWENFDVFWTSNDVNTKEIIATQIDTAFEYCLTLNDSNVKSIGLFGDGFGLITSYSNLSLIYAKDLINVRAFSKFDVGLVWYYYDLFLFDIFLGYAGVMTGVVLLFNLILGLASRLFYLIIMFLAYPPITGLFPLDEGRGVKTWRTEFMKSYLAVYGTIVGLNIVLIILPFLRSIKLFNVGFLDALITALFTLAGLVVIKKVIAMFSKLIGAEDLQEAGAKMAKDFASTTTKAIKGVMKFADVGISAGKALGKTNLGVINGTAKAINASKKKKINKQMQDANIKPKGEDGEYTDDQRKAFTFMQKNRNQYLSQAHKITDAEIGGDVNTYKQHFKQDYYQKVEENVQKLAEADMQKKSSKSKKVDEKISSRKGFNFGHKALQNLNKRYGKKNVDAMRKNDNDLYRSLLDEEKRKVASEEVRAERAKALKGAGGQVVDITGQALKLVQDIAGVSGIGEMFKKEGVTDAWKTTAQNFLKAVGNPEAAKSDMLKTTKQKDDGDKEAKKKYRTDLESLAKDFENQVTTGQIEALTNEFKRYYSKRLGEEAVQEYLKKKDGKYKDTYKKLSKTEKQLYEKYVQEDKKKADKLVEDKLNKTKKDIQTDNNNKK